MNHEISKIVGLWKNLDKRIKIAVCILLIILLMFIIFTSCSGSKKKVNTHTAEKSVEIFLQHDGKDVLNNIPKACKKAVIDNYNITEDELEETISTYANGIYGKAYLWDFSIEDKQYDVTAKDVTTEFGGKITLKELQEWDENRASSTEDDLNAWAAKDQTLNKIESISEIWSDIYDVNNICLVNYTYDLYYIENKTGTEGCDEDDSMSLTFVNYKGDWYCLEIIDLAVNGIETNANNDSERELWNKYFGSFE